MSLAAALALAAQGFHVFPLIPNGKLPQVADFANVSTRDPVALRQLFWCGVMQRDHGYNVGIYCGKFGDDPAVSLCVIDVDNKNGKNGTAEVQKLIPELGLTPTYIQSTPTGGFHFVYANTATPVANSVGATGRSRFAAGLDIRGRGGFIVGAGSVVPAGAYAANGAAVAVAPAALIERCEPYQAPREDSSTDVPDGVDGDRAAQRAAEYLRTAPRSIKGAGGDATAYHVAARLKDFGVSEAMALELMMSEHWEHGCGWSAERLAVKIANAFSYGRSAPGSAAPEVLFKPAGEASAPVEVPAATLPVETITALMTAQDEAAANIFNKDHALLLIQGKHYVLWEKVGRKKRREVVHMPVDTFVAWNADKYIVIDEKKVPLSRLWLAAPGSATDPGDGRLWRRSYSGVEFAPEQETEGDLYNTWRGFQFTPWQGPMEDAPAGWRWALEAWKTHLLENVCNGDRKLAHWLTGWFAHLIQKPWEKPLVAIVLIGGQGTGKSAVLKRVGDLLGEHCLSSAKPRYLLSQFNGHMDSLSLFVMEEAFWAGNHAAESELKDLITSDEHVIERKGKEIYSVNNCTRVALNSNKAWVLPTDHDDRRYCVFNIGLGRKKDRVFFERMRLEMQHPQREGEAKGIAGGGGALLLRYLMDFDLSTVDVNDAPQTTGLADQKLQSLDPIEAFWHQCLVEGYVPGSGFAEGEWPKSMAKADFRIALSEYRRLRNIRSQGPTDMEIGRKLHTCCPQLRAGREGKDRGGKNGRTTYVFPELAVARASWDSFIGRATDWQ